MVVEGWLGLMLIAGPPPTARLWPVPRIPTQSKGFFNCRCGPPPSAAPSCALPPASPAPALSPLAAPVPPRPTPLAAAEPEPALALAPEPPEPPDLTVSIVPVLAIPSPVEPPEVPDVEVDGAPVGRSLVPHASPTKSEHNPYGEPKRIRTNCSLLWLSNRPELRLGRATIIPPASLASA